MSTLSMILKKNKRCLSVCSLHNFILYLNQRDWNRYKIKIYCQKNELSNLLIKEKTKNLLNNHTCVKTLIAECVKFNKKNKKRITEICNPIITIQSFNIINTILKRKHIIRDIDKINNYNNSNTKFSTKKTKINIKAKSNLLNIFIKKFIFYSK